MIAISKLPIWIIFSKEAKNSQNFASSQITTKQTEPRFSPTFRNFEQNRRENEANYSKISRN
jgi:hypothetical protein